MLDPAEPGIADVVQSAKVGEPLVLREITVIPTAIDQTRFEADVAALTMDEMAEAPEVAPETTPMPEQMRGMPMTNEGGFDEGQM